MYVCSLMHVIMHASMNTYKYIQSTNFSTKLFQVQMAGP